jgi:hypothetical protein
MDSWLTYHRTSEAVAAQAHEHLRAGDRTRAQDAFRRAAEAEQVALELLDVSKPRTLGATAVSAVSLWYKAREFEHALRVAHRYLAMPELIESARVQLDDLILAVYSERDKARLAGDFLPGSVTVAVRGGEVLRGAAPLELIVDRVKTLESMFYRVVEWQTGKPLRRRGPPTRDITRKFAPWLVQEAPGSFQFSVAVKLSGQRELFTAEQLEAADIARKFLDVVTTLSTDATGEASKALVPDEEYRKTFRTLVRNLTPPAGSGESITLTAKDREDTVAVLDEAARPRLAEALRAEQPFADTGELQEQFVGVLRALDLDKDWLKVEVQGKQMVVRQLPAAVDDLIGPMVNKLVRVTAKRQGLQGELTYLDVDLAPELPAST